MYPTKLFLLQNVTALLQNAAVITKMRRSLQNASCIHCVFTRDLLYTFCLLEVHGNVIVKLLSQMNKYLHKVLKFQSSTFFDYFHFEWLLYQFINCLVTYLFNDFLMRKTLIAEELWVTFFINVCVNTKNLLILLIVAVILVWFGKVIWSYKHLSYCPKVYHLYFQICLLTTYIFLFSWRFFQNEWWSHRIW